MVMNFLNYEVWAQQQQRLVCLLPLNRFTSTVKPLVYHYVPDLLGVSCAFSFSFSILIWDNAPHFTHFCCTNWLCFGASACLQRLVTSLCILLHNSNNYYNSCTLWLFNITMVYMAHRNRWFTYQQHGDFPWQTVSHNQMASGVHFIYRLCKPWQ